MEVGCQVVFAKKLPTETFCSFKHFKGLWKWKEIKNIYVIACYISTFWKHAEFNDIPVEQNEANH